MRTNVERLQQQVNRVVEQLLERERTLDERPVRPPRLRELAAAFREAELPDAGIGEERALSECLERIAPGMSTTSLRDFALVIGSTTPAALVGDLLVSIWDQCVILHDHDTIAPQVEEQTAQMLLDLFRLPRAGFTATFTTGTSASNLVALACARQWWGERHGVDVAEAGLSGLPPAEVFAGAPHSSVSKALSDIGLGRASLRRVPTLPGRTAVDVEALERALQASSARAKIVVAGAGEVNTGDFDDLGRIADLCAAHEAWLHVDGAFGLFARCAPAYAPLAAGVERADSIATDLHKLLNVPFDSGLVVLSTRRAPLLPRVFSAVAPYLGSVGPEPGRVHPMNTRVENSARFRALPTWMTLKAYGRAGYREFVERIGAHARALAAWIEGSAGYALACKPMFNVVLFRGLHPDGAAITLPEDNERLIDAINATGRIHVTRTAFGGLPAIRASFAKWQTGDGDIAIAEQALADGVRSFWARGRA